MFSHSLNVFPTFLDHFQHFSVFSAIFGSLAIFGLFRQLLGFFDIFRDFSAFFGICWNFSAFFGIFGNLCQLSAILGNFRHFWGIFLAPGWSGCPVGPNGTISFSLGHREVWKRAFLWAFFHLVNPVWGLSLVFGSRLIRVLRGAQQCNQFRSRTPKKYKNRCLQYSFSKPDQPREVGRYGIWLSSGEEGCGEGLTRAGVPSWTSCDYFPLSWLFSKTISTIVKNNHDRGNCRGK